MLFVVYLAAHLQFKRDPCVPWVPPVSQTPRWGCPTLLCPAVVEDCSRGTKQSLFWKAWTSEGRFPASSEMQHLRGLCVWFDQEIFFMSAPGGFWAALFGLCIQDFQFGHVFFSPSGKEPKQRSLGFCKRVMPRLTRNFKCVCLALQIDHVLTGFNGFNPPNLAEIKTEITCDQTQFFPERRKSQEMRCCLISKQISIFYWLPDLFPFSDFFVCVSAATLKAKTTNSSVLIWTGQILMQFPTPLNKTLQDCVGAWFPLSLWHLKSTWSPPRKFLPCHLKSFRGASWERVGCK